MSYSTIQPKTLFLVALVPKNKHRTKVIPLYYSLHLYTFL